MLYCRGGDCMIHYLFKVRFLVGAPRLLWGLSPQATTTARVARVQFDANGTSTGAFVIRRQKPID